MKTNKGILLYCIVLDEKSIYNYDTFSIKWSDHIENAKFIEKM
jgi:hypothetical protein